MIDLTIVKRMLQRTVSLKESLKSNSSTSRSGSMGKITAGLGVALVVLSGSFKLYYDKTEAEKEQMAAQLRQAADNQLLLENSIKGLNEQVLQAEEDKKITFQKINLLQEQNRKSLEEVNNLKSKFDKHNMNMLSLRKPKLIENIINKGTKGVLNDFETLTTPVSSSQ